MAAATRDADTTRTANSSSTTSDPPPTQRAVDLSRPHTLTFRGDAPTPAPASTSYPRGTVLVRGVVASICGSDLLYHELDAMRELDKTSVGGSLHEVIGRVAAGSNSDRFKPGALVLALPTNYIRTHRLVHRDMSDEEAEALTGVPATGGGAEFFLSHERYCYPLAETPSGRSGLPLHCMLAAQPLGTILWALRHLGNVIGKDCVVLGQGQNGLLMTAMLAQLGARRVIAVDLVASRLEVAKRMHATHVIDARAAAAAAVSSGDGSGSIGSGSGSSGSGSSGGDGDEGSVETQVRRITGGAMADIVVEIVGHQTSTLNECIPLCKFQGTILAFGVPKDAVYPINFSALFRQNITLVPTVFADATVDFPLAVDMISQGRVDVTPLFTHQLPLEALPRAYGAHHACSGGIIKTVVRLNEDEAAAEPCGLPELPVGATTVTSGEGGGGGGGAQ